MAFNVSRILLAAAGSVVAVHATATEIVLTGAHAYTQVALTGTHYVENDNNDLSTNIALSGWGAASTAITDASRPSVFASTASGQGAGQDIEDAVADSNFAYYYTVIGATGPVPVDFDYDLQITNTDFGEAMADFSVTNDYPFYAPAIDIGFATDQFSASGGTHELAGTASTNDYVGQINQVLLIVRTQANVGYLEPSQTATAFADPHIYIDPAYLAANPGVSLEISDGVGNLGPSPVSSVPEPANVAFVLAGLSLITALRRRPQPHRWSPEADPTDPPDPSMWSEIKTQRPVVLGLAVWLLALALGCMMLAPPAAGTEDWVGQSVSDGQGAPVSPLDVAGCDAQAGAVCGVLEAPAAPTRMAAAH